MYLFEAVYQNIDTEAFRKTTFENHNEHLKSRVEIFEDTFKKAVENEKYDEILVRFEFVGLK